MKTYYEIVTWDCGGYGLQDPVQRADTIADLALLFGSPADAIWAVEDGGRRELTDEEKLELEREIDRIARAGRPPGKGDQHA
jgi:hypothetical protein